MFYIKDTLIHIAPFHFHNTKPVRKKRVPNTYTYVSTFHVSAWFKKPQKIQNRKIPKKISTRHGDRDNERKIYSFMCTVDHTDWIYTRSSLLCLQFDSISTLSSTLFPLPSSHFMVSSIDLNFKYTFNTNGSIKMHDDNCAKNQLLLKLCDDWKEKICTTLTPPIHKSRKKKFNKIEFLNPGRRFQIEIHKYVNTTKTNE